MNTLSGYSLILTDTYTYAHNQENRKISSLGQTSVRLLCSQLPSLRPALGNTDLCHFTLVLAWSFI